MKNNEISDSSEYSYIGIVRVSKNLSDLNNTAGTKIDKENLVSVIYTLGDIVQKLENTLSKPNGLLSKLISNQKETLSNDDSGSEPDKKRKRTNKKRKSKNESAIYAADIGKEKTKNETLKSLSENDTLVKIYSLLLDYKAELIKSEKLQEVKLDEEHAQSEIEKKENSTGSLNEEHLKHISKSIDTLPPIFENMTEILSDILKHIKKIGLKGGGGDGDTTIISPESEPGTNKDKKNKTPEEKQAEKDKKGKATKQPSPKPGTLGKALRGGIGGLVISEGVDKLTDYFNESGHPTLGALSDIGSDAITGASIGGTIGSIIPPLAPVAAAVGGVAGAAYGVTQNAGKLFGSTNSMTKPKEVAEPKELAKIEGASIEEKALLDTIAVGESGGRYDAQFGSKKGFGEGMSDEEKYKAHPNIRNEITRGPNAGKTSSAAGKYQFLKSTWDEVSKELGLKDFTPENQDKAALYYAKKKYKERTGRDLSEDVKDKKNLPTIFKELNKIWTSLPAGSEEGAQAKNYDKIYEKNLAKHAAKENTPEAIEIAKKFGVEKTEGGGLQLPEEGSSKDLTKSTETPLPDIDAQIPEKNALVAPTEVKQLGPVKENEPVKAETNQTAAIPEPVKVETKQAAIPEKVNEPEKSATKVSSTEVNTIPVTTNAETKTETKAEPVKAETVKPESLKEDTLKVVDLVKQQSVSPIVTPTESKISKALDNNIKQNMALNDTEKTRTETKVVTIPQSSSIEKPQWSQQPNIGVASSVRNDDPIFIKISMSNWEKSIV